jgi:hypothetical protein
VRTQNAAERGEGGGADRAAVIIHAQAVIDGRPEQAGKQSGACLASSALELTVRASLRCGSGEGMMTPISPVPQVNGR